MANFAVGPLGPGGSQAIVVTSYQVPNYPSQVALLSSGGSLVGEYWHSGYLEHLSVQGRTIFLAGISNGYRAATLVALDADHIEGASAEENPAYQIQGFQRAHEKARLIFPRSCINRKYEEYNLPRSLTFSDGLLTLMIEEKDRSAAGSWHHFAPDLTLRRYEFADSFRALHAQLRAAGQLDHDLSPAEEEKLKDIRYLVR